MDKISKALKCAECREILRSPVILPCGLSVCKHHTEAKSSFYCMSCADEHSSPRGFPSNKALEEMIAAEIQELDLGKEHKLALDLCAQLDTTIEKLASAYENPELYIHEKMSSLKNKVDLKRELLKLRIDEIADKMIEKVVKYEDECVTHSKSSSFKTDFEEVDDKVKSAKDDCKKWSANLNRLRVDVVDFENTSKKCAGLIGTLEKKFLEIDSVLLMGKALTFQHEIETFENFEIRFNFNNNLGLDFKFNNDEFGVKNIKEEKYDRTRSILQDLEYPRFEERSNLRSLGANGTEFGTELSSDDDLEDEVDFSPISRTRSQLLTPRDRSTSRLLGFDEFYTYTPPRTTDEATKTPVGRYRSRGSANGRPVYRGPRGGLFYLNSSGFKQYINASQVELDE